LLGKCRFAVLSKQNAGTPTFTTAAAKESQWPTSSFPFTKPIAAVPGNDEMISDFKHTSLCPGCLKDFGVGFRVWKSRQGIREGLFLSIWEIVF
jgi:hypothetical protein